jgi:hypothetical protein
MVDSTSTRLRQLAYFEALADCPCAITGINPAETASIASR